MYKFTLSLHTTVLYSSYKLHYIYSNCTFFLTLHLLIPLQTALYPYIQQHFTKLNSTLFSHTAALYSSNKQHFIPTHNTSFLFTTLYPYIQLHFISYKQHFIPTHNTLSLQTALYGISFYKWQNVIPTNNSTLFLQITVFHSYTQQYFIHTHNSILFPYTTVLYS